MRSATDRALETQVIIHYMDKKYYFAMNEVMGMQLINQYKTENINILQAIFQDCVSELETFKELAA